MKSQIVFGLFVISLAVASSHFINPNNLLRMQNTVYAPQADFFMAVSPTVLTKSEEWVVVKFGGIEKPHKHDWIGIYSPANADVTKTSPTKWQYAEKADSYLSTGAGYLNFTLVNMHSDVAFAFFRNGTEHPVLVGKSNVITFKNANEPLQGHIALTDKDHEIKVMWNTGYNAGTQFIKYGTQSGVYTKRISADRSRTYTAKDLCGSPATDFGWKDPGLFHDVLLENLIPGTKYYYVYGNDDVTGWSSESSFFGPSTPHASEDITFIAFGDMGKGEVDGSREHWEEVPSLETCKHMKDQVDDIDMVLHIGDIAYAVGYSSQWDEFMEQIRPVASRVPYMTLAGNHERDYPGSGSWFNGTDSGGECGIPFEHRFQMPGATRAKPWYSFEFGPVHFVMMDTEIDFAKGSHQEQWISQDLAKVDRKRTPWVIFSGHRPMYIDSAGADDQIGALWLRQGLEDLLLRYKVDLAFWGHHHSYQRTCPIYDSKCHGSGNVLTNPQYPIHVVIGMAGMGLSQNLQSPQPDWIEYVDDLEYGYTRLWVNSTSITMKYYGNESGLKDEFVVKKI